MGVFSLILRINNEECFRNKAVSELIEKLSVKYGFSLVKVGGNYIATPNLEPLLYYVNINRKYAPLFKYVSLLRFLISRGCLSIVKVVSDFKYNTIVNSFVRFLNNGVDSNGVLWRTIATSTIDGVSVHNVVVNNEVFKLKPDKFDEVWFKSNLVDAYRLIKTKESKYFIVKPTPRSELVVKGDIYSLSELHVMSLIKLVGLNIEKGLGRRLEYFKEYHKCHPFNSFVHNVAEHMLDIDLEACDLTNYMDLGYGELDALISGKALNTNTNMKKIPIVKRIAFSDICDCVFNGKCDMVDWGVLKRHYNIIAPLVLIRVVKNTLINSGKLDHLFRDITGDVFRRLFYPDYRELFRSMGDVLCDDYSIYRGEDKDLSVTLYYKLFTNNVSVPYFVGINFRSRDNTINEWFEVFNYSPITVVGRDCVYYNRGRFGKYKDVVFTPKHVLLSFSIVDDKKNIYLAYV